MSLTTLIAEPEIRDRLKKLISRPVFDGSGRKLLAPPMTKNYSLMGTAFDYLLRFYLKRLNPQAIDQDKWLAEEVSLGFEGILMTDGSDRIEVVPELATTQSGRDLALQRERILTEAKENYRLYMKAGKVTDQLLSSVIGLAKLDIINRTGQTDLVDLANDDERDREDLRQLVKVIPAGDFKTKELCILNPTFGEASRLAGGADADVIIDDILIEIKTVMKCQLQPKYLHQLVGYYCLYRIGGVSGMPAGRSLRRLGVYFSRFGYLYTVPMKECWKARDFSDFLKWFEESIRARADQRAADSAEHER
jgi:hypothetical protein